MNRALKALFLFIVVAGVAAFSEPAHADKTVAVQNKTNKAVTLSDFYAFSGEKCTGTKTTILKNKADEGGGASDDVNIAANGKRNVTVPNDTKSVRISWINNDGKEVETDWNSTNDFDITDKNMCAFNAPSFGGKFAIDLPKPWNGVIPPDGANVNIVNGKISGGLYDGMTFYDVTSSAGDIQRDVNGNPTSPLLNGVSMTVDMHYSLLVSPVVPAVSPIGFAVLAFALVLLAFVVLRRRSHGTSIA